MWRGKSWFRSGVSLAIVGAVAATVACGDDASTIRPSHRGKGGTSGAGGSGGGGGATGGSAGSTTTGGSAGTGVSGSGGAGSGGGGSGGVSGGGSGGTDVGGEGGQGGDGLGGEGGDGGTGMSGMGGASGMGGKGGAGAGGAGAGGIGGAGAGGAGAGAGGAGAGGAGAGGKGGAGAGGAGAGAGGAGAGGAGAGGAGAGGTGGMAMAPNLFFSEYVEGQMLADAFEIYNASAASVNLSGCEVRVHYGAAAGSTAVTLSGTLAAGDVQVLCLQRVSTACDVLTPGLMDLSGDDSVELACMVNNQSVTLDVIGQFGPGLDPGMEWGGNPGTQNQTLRRRCNVTTGDRNATNMFVPNTQWLGFDADTVNGLGARTCPCPALDQTCP